MSDNWDAAGKPEQPKGRSIHEFFAGQLREKFMTLPKEHADLIRNAHAAGFKWSGEDTYHTRDQLNGLTHFEHVYEEWQLMKEIGLSEYRQGALARMDAYRRRSAGSNRR